MTHMVRLLLNGRALALSLSILAGQISTVSAETITTVTVYEYDSSNRVAAVTKHPSDPTLNLRTQFTYDGWGHRTSTAVSSTATGNVAITARTVEQVFYGGTGYVPTLFWDALRHQSTVGYDANNFPAYVDSLNGLRDYLTYDYFGRITTRIQHDSKRTDYTYNLCSSSSPCSAAAAAYVVTATTTLAPKIVTYYDSLERVVRTETTGFDGSSVIVVDTEYDELGRVKRASRPYYQGQPVQWTVYSYDILGRVVEVVAPDGGVTHTDYNGLTTTITNALNQTVSTTVNSRGLPAQIVDNLGGILKYTYDAGGRLTSTTDPAGNIVRASYDLAGNKISMSDPDLGTITYVYDALGLVRQQTDAKAQVTTYQYDLLNRVTKRNEPDLVSTFTYDCNMGVGKLCTATADNGYRYAVGYDFHSRPSNLSVTMDQTYSYTYMYGAYSLLASVSSPVIRVNYGYNSAGYLKEIRGDPQYDPDTDSNLPGKLYWQANAMDAEGHLLQQMHGNGILTSQEFAPSTGHLTAIRAGANNSVQNIAYTYDRLGNVLTRSDNTQSLAESFLYDGLNRLTSNTVNSSGAGLITQAYSYDSIGNITTRSDAGTYNYGAANALPHALAKLTRADGGVRQFSYDLSGNLIQEIEKDSSGNVLSAKGRTVTWTSFNMPASITGGSGTVRYVYGTSHQRVKEINPGYTTYFVHPDNAGGLLYEKDVRSDGSVEHRTFVTAPSVGVVALIKQPDQTYANHQVLYMHRDVLGSVTAVSNDAGTVIERMAYEPFGKRRTVAGALDPANTLRGLTTNRGYTNHEELDSLTLVHMNGRVYDPALSRFLSPDSHVPYPLEPQSYNRYAYVQNNPLSRTDPTGYEDKRTAGSNPLQDLWDYVTALFGGHDTEGTGLSGGAYMDQIAAQLGGTVQMSPELSKPIPTVEVPGSASWNAAGNQISCSGDCLYELTHGGNFYNDYAGREVGTMLTIAAMGIPVGEVAAVGLNVAKAATISFKTSHYAARLEAVGLNVARAESAVAEAINAIRGNIATKADFWGRFEIDNITVEYRARLLEDGTINVGTVFPVM